MLFYNSELFTINKMLPDRFSSAALWYYSSRVEQLCRQNDLKPWLHDTRKSRVSSVHETGSKCQLIPEIKPPIREYISTLHQFMLRGVNQTKKAAMRVNECFNFQ